MGDIQEHNHGKGRVRVAKRWVDASTGINHFIDFNCEATTWSPDCEKSYTVGDNTMVVATDTCKNIAYVVAKEHTFSSPEEFATLYAQRFLEAYPHIIKTRVTVIQVPWERATVAGRSHKHAFVPSSGTTRWAATAVAVRNQPTVITSEIRGMVVLKTTQSGWSDFHRNEYTLLADTGERMMASSVTARWEYKEPVAASGQAEGKYVVMRATISEALLATFTGPPDTGSFSPGVQYTLHKMGLAALQAVPEVSSITLNMPNIHYLPAKLLDAMGIHKFEDDVFIPTDEPHGTIQATITRPKAKL